MLGIHFWGLHQPDRGDSPRSSFPSAPSTTLPPIVLAGIALLIVTALALLAQPSYSVGPALVLAVAGGGMLLMQRATPSSIAARPAPTSGTGVASAPVAERLTAIQFEAAPITASNMPYAYVKRAGDLAAALLLAFVTLPLFPLIALAIRIDSPGAVFYTQDRIGQDGRIFRIYKFRTMRTDAERAGAVWATAGDPRVTRVGAFMRRSRLDELPQLLNVLRGEMTFVGPRPERPEFTRVLVREVPGYTQRTLVKPGLTGWAQIRYQYASSIQDSETKLEYDLYYVRHRSLRFDAMILVQTIPVVLHLRGR